MDTLKDTVYNKIVTVIKNNQIDIHSPFSIITKGMEIINTMNDLNGHEKKALLIKTLRTLAAGKDGVAGTSDDLLPPRVVDEVQRMIDNGLIDDYVAVVKDVTKGKFDFKQAVDVAVRTAPFCLQLCGKKLS